jgi:flagellar protein FlaF
MKTKGWGMSLRAYEQAAQRVESPRDLEYRLFGVVTRSLIEAAAMDQTQIGARMEALDWNRRMWSTLAADCQQPGNALPKPLRAQIVSLSLWVGRHTSQVMRGQEQFEPLIDINRIIMQGLAGQAEAA